MENTSGSVEYPVSTSYRSSWGDWEAVREIYQNAVDTKSKVTMRATATRLVIQDKGPGIQLSNLLIGETTKDGVDTIGKFGEGFKFGLLVLLRDGRKVDIRSGDLHLTPRLKDMFGRQCLTIDYRRNGSSVDGTKVVIEGLDVSSYAGRFLPNVREQNFKNRVLMDKPGMLFIKGIFVRKINSSVGYNLNMERENPMSGDVSMYDVHNYVAGLIEATQDNNYIRRVLDSIDSGSTYLEKEVGPYKKWNMESPRRWRNALVEKFDARKFCELTDSRCGKIAEYQGYKLITSNAPFLNGLLKNDVDVISTDKQTKGIRITKDTIDPSVRSLVRKLRNRFMTLLKTEIPPIKFRDWPTDGPKVLGKARHGSHISLSVHILVPNNQEEIVSTFIHELVHFHWGYQDTTEEFTEGMNTLATMLFLKK
jgi:hypothetical protein